MAVMGYTTVRVNIGALIIDGIDDDDIYDDAPVSGKMILEPMLEANKPVQVSDGGRMKIKAITAFPVDIGLTGEISHRNKDFVTVPAPTSVTSNVAQLQWRAKFMDLKYGLTKVEVPPIYFYAEPGASIDLGDHVNIAPNPTAVQLSRGARGFGVVGAVPVVGEPTPAFAIEYETAVGTALSTPIALPEGGGTPSNSTIAGIVSTGPTKTALDNTYAPTGDYVSGTDPRIDELYDFDGNEYVEATVDLSGRLLRGTTTDGTQEVAALRIVGEPATTTNADVEGVSWTPYVDASGRIPEVHLDNSGEVPQSTLNRWASRMSIQAVSPTQPIVLIHSLGQSNAVRSDSLPLSIAEPDPRILQWNGTAWITHPTAATEYEYLGYFLARQLVQSGRLPIGTRVGVVQHAIGSTGFSSTDENPAPAGRNYSPGGTWDRKYVGSTINLYVQFKARALAAMTAAPATSRHYLALWSQGEQDRSFRTQTTYATDLDDLITQARTDLAVSDLPFLIGSMTGGTMLANTGATVGIDRAHEDSTRRLARTAFIRGPYGADKHEETIHYSSQAQLTRSRLFAQAIDTALLNVATVKPLPPENIRVARSGADAVIEWDHPQSRVTAYTIQTSTDSGSTWATATLAIPVAHKVSVTAAATLPLWVRGSATNEIGTSYITSEVKA